MRAVGGAITVPGSVVTLGAAFWGAMARYHGGIHIQRNPIESDVVKYPTINLGLHVLVTCHVKFGEQSHNGLVTRYMFPLKQTRYGLVETGDFSMGKTIGTTPDADDKLFHIWISR